MNYIKHLTGFFDRIINDHSLNPTHISLYIGLFQHWNINRFQNPISITRDEIMRISKICSKATYHKCMRELNDKGYINYQPSFNPFRGSMVILFNFADDLKPVQKKESMKQKILPVTEQAVNKSHTSSETSTEQALVSSINYINNTNNSNDKNVLNLDKPVKKFEEINDSSGKIVIPSAVEVFLSKEEKSSAKKEMFSTFADSDKNKNGKQKEFIVTSSVSSRAQSRDEKPTIENVKIYFQENNFPEQEAQKFFNYFKSIGWLVGGKTPMVDWQAAAQNWMLNSTNFNHTSTITPQNHRQNSNTTTDKDYSEPL